MVKFLTGFVVGSTLMGLVALYGWIPQTLEDFVEVQRCVDVYSTVLEDEGVKELAKAEGYAPEELLKQRCSHWVASGKKFPRK